MEVYKGKPIWYALGNFVFDQTWSEPTMEGITLELTFRGKELVQVRMRPHLILGKAQPNFMDPCGAARSSWARSGGVQGAAAPGEGLARGWRTVAALDQPQPYGPGRAPSRPASRSVSWSGAGTRDSRRTNASRDQHSRQASSAESARTGSRR